MKPHRRQRLFFLICIVAALSGALFLAFNALQQNINLFFSPAQVRAGEVPALAKFRLGGMVVKNSVVRGDAIDDFISNSSGDSATDSAAELAVKFSVTDTVNEVDVIYHGILPDLFREGQGIVALGIMHGDIFIAEQVLAKHDETYMPAEVYDAIRQAKNLPKTDK